MRKGAASRVETTLGKPDEPAPGQWTPGRNGYCTHGAFSENAGNLEHDGAVEGNGYVGTNLIYHEFVTNP